MCVRVCCDADAHRLYGHGEEEEDEEEGCAGSRRQDMRL